MLEDVLELAVEFLADLIGIVSFAQIWQCGCGLLAPMISPRFSKICTWLM